MTKLLVRTFLLVVGLVGATVSATPTSECAYTNYRLPRDIVPKHYDLILSVDNHQLECIGSVTIEIEVIRDKNEQLAKDIIVLNAHRDIVISQLTYSDIHTGASSSSTSIRPTKVKQICRDHNNEQLVITLDKDLPDRARGELKISFETKIRGDRTGIFKSNDRISTDFKPDRARRAFPCFDEPSFKSTFDINLFHAPTHTALANTARLSDELRNGLKLSVFETTPPISTYLVAFVIGKFDHIETKLQGRDLTISAFTPAGKSEQARFALDTAVKAIDYLEDYFAFPFPLKKLDLLTGVGRNFGASDNWGLIICTEPSLLFDNYHTSPFRKGHIAQSVVKALAQQWFGNLVTMNWWTDLWLNEGLTAWIGVNATSELYPEEEWEQNYMIEEYQKALDSDSQGDISAVRVHEVGRDIYKSFSEDAFVKSNAIVKFLHDVYVGPEKFRLGIRQYLTKYQRQNADAIDLWNELKTVSELPVYQFIKSWTEQAGHPLVRVRMLEDDTNRLIFEQGCELPPGVSDNNPIPQKWIIPLTIRFSDKQGNQEVIKYNFDQSTLVVDPPEWFDIRRYMNVWLKVNDNSSGFYRVLYSEFLLTRLQSPCQTKQLNLNDRIGLNDDVNALFSRSLLIHRKYVKALSCNLAGQLEGPVIGQVVRAYARLRIRPEREITELCEKFLMSPTLDLNSLPNRGTRLRPEIQNSVGLVDALSILVDFNNKPLIYALLNEFDDDGNAAALSIRGLIYQIVYRFGSPNQLYLLKSYVKHPYNDDEERKRLTVALSRRSKRDKWLQAASSGAQ